jgi:hypothetical protein
MQEEYLLFKDPMELILGKSCKPERERSIEREKRRIVGKLGGDRKSDQDLESGLVFDEQEREKQSLCS